MLTSLTLVAAVRWTSVALLFITIICTLLLAHLVRTWFFGGRDDTTSRRPATSKRPAARTAKRQPAAGRKKVRRK